MDKNFHVTFDQCPNCGSTQQFFQQLGQELKDRGLARSEWNMHYDSRQGVAVDQLKQNLMLVGTSLPGFIIVTDICMDCGTVYAVELRRIDAQTKAVPRGTVPPQLPNPFRKN